MDRPARAHHVNQPSGQNGIQLARTQSVLGGKKCILRRVPDGDRAVMAKRLDRAFDTEYILLADAIVVVGIHKHQRQYPEIDQILPVDARKALGDNHPQTEIARRQRGVLSSGTLAWRRRKDQSRDC